MSMKRVSIFAAIPTVSSHMAAVDPKTMQLVGRHLQQACIKSNTAYEFKCLLGYDYSSDSPPPIPVGGYGVNPTLWQDSQDPSKTYSKITQCSSNQAWGSGVHEWDVYNCAYDRELKYTSARLNSAPPYAANQAFPQSPAHEFVGAPYHCPSYTGDSKECEVNDPSRQPYDEVTFWHSPLGGNDGNRFGGLPLCLAGGFNIGNPAFFYYPSADWTSLGSPPPRLPAVAASPGFRWSDNERRASMMFDTSANHGGYLRLYCCPYYEMDDNFDLILDGSGNRIRTSDEWDCFEKCNMYLVNDPTFDSGNPDFDAEDAALNNNDDTVNQDMFMHPGPTEDEQWKGVKPKAGWLSVVKSRVYFNDPAALEKFNDYVIYWGGPVPIYDKNNNSWTTRCQKDGNNVVCDDNTSPLGNENYYFFGGEGWLGLSVVHFHLHKKFRQLARYGVTIAFRWDLDDALFTTCVDGYVGDAQPTLPDADIVTCSSDLTAAGCVRCGDDQNECIACSSNTILMNGTCEPCLVQNCDRCSSEDQNQCADCETGFFLQNGACEECMATNCLTCEGDSSTCGQCAYGFFLADGQPGECQQCQVENCGQCQSETSCETCMDGYFLDNDSCTPCPDNCLECSSDTQCNTCQNGYFPDPDNVGSCAPCGENCGFCDSTQCITCSPDFQGFPSGKECVSCAQQYGDACDTCNDTGCTSCAGDLVLSPDDSSCVPCEAMNCNQCKPGNPNECATDGCAPHFGWSSTENKCVAIVSECLTDDGKQGYINEHAYCSPCEQHCQSCTLDGCVMADAGYQLQRTSGIPYPNGALPECNESAPEYFVPPNESLIGGGDHLCCGEFQRLQYGTSESHPNVCVCTGAGTQFGSPDNDTLQCTCLPGYVEVPNDQPGPLVCVDPNTPPTASCPNDLPGSNTQVIDNACTCVDGTYPLVRQDNDLLACSACDGEAEIKLGSSPDCTCAQGYKPTISESGAGVCVVAFPDCSVQNCLLCAKEDECAEAQCASGYVLDSQKQCVPEPSVNDTDGHTCLLEGLTPGTLHSGVCVALDSCEQPKVNGDGCINKFNGRAGRCDTANNCSTLSSENHGCRLQDEGKPCGNGWRGICQNNASSTHATCVSRVSSCDAANSGQPCADTPLKYLMGRCSYDTATLTATCMYPGSCHFPKTAGDPCYYWSGSSSLQGKCGADYKCHPSGLSVFNTFQGSTGTLEEQL